jgi:hypothetical protein
LESPALQRLSIAYFLGKDGITGSKDLHEASITVAFFRRSRIVNLETFALEYALAETIKEILPHMPEVDKLALRRMPDEAAVDVFGWLAKTPRQELRFSTLYMVGWMSEIVDEDLEALCDMIARRNPPGSDVRNPSPKEVFLMTKVYRRI